MDADHYPAFDRDRPRQKIAQAGNFAWWDEFFSRLDAALVRSGRLQQRVTVLPPQASQEVVAVLRFYLGNELTQLDLGPLAQVGLGATPATIEGWVTMARAAAHSESRALNGRDILAQIVPMDDRQPEDIRAIALHEVGHALVAHRLGHMVETVSIIASGSTAGHMRSASGTIVPSMTHIQDSVTIMLGGRAADIVLGAGANAGAAGDLEAATRLLLAAHERQGLGGKLLFVPAVSAKPSAVTVSAVAADLQILLERAITIVAAEHDPALALADRLIEARVLSGADDRRSRQ